MDLRQLEYFQIVCRENNITRAAEKLHISQPSISTAIHKLENELGIVLFDRTKKQITLTDAGSIFLQRVDEILIKIENAMSEMNDCSNQFVKTLKIGVPPMIGTFLFPHIFINYRKQFPEVNLEISEHGSVSIQKMIEIGELDLGIVIISEASNLLNTHAIWESEIVVCLNKNHPLSSREELTFADLIEEPIIMLKEGFYNRRIIMDSFKKHHIKPNIVLSSNQLETIKSLIINGVGISFLFKETVKHYENIVSIPFVEPVNEVIGLAWRTDRYLTQTSQSFIDFITRSLEGL